MLRRKAYEANFGYRKWSQKMTESQVASYSRPDISRLSSHWSSSNNTVLSLVERFIVLKYFHSDATLALLCHKEPAQGMECILCLSLVLYSIRIGGFL